MKDEGTLYALQRNLEVQFQTYKYVGKDIPLQICGALEKDLIDLFKHALKGLKDSEQEHVRIVWLEQLITLAKAAGARILPKK